MLLVLLAAAAAPTAPTPSSPPITAREAVEIQLAAPAEPAAAPMTGAEVARIRKRYLDRIGQMIAPRVETGGSTVAR